jgi:hypothetical protein
MKIIGLVLLLVCFAFTGVAFAESTSATETCLRQGVLWSFSAGARGSTKNCEEFVHGRAV